MIHAKQPSRDRLRALQTTLQEHFKARPHVVEVRFFGSLAQGMADQYSDLDLTVVTTDLATSVNDRYAIVQSLGPLDLEWLLESSPQHEAVLITR